MKNNEQNQLPEKDSTRQMTPASEKGMREEETQMSVEELNDYVCKSAKSVCNYIGQKRAELGIQCTSDIIPPICSADWSLQQNITNLMACFSNTAAEGLSILADYARLYKQVEDSIIIKNKAP